MLIREKFPLEHYPELTLDQTNSPDPNDALSANKIEPGTFLQMETGNVSNVYVSAIVSGGQIYIQRPENPTFEALHRLECCMSQVYETLQSRVPTGKISSCLGNLIPSRFSHKLLNYSASRSH